MQNRTILAALAGAVMLLSVFHAGGQDRKSGPDTAAVRGSAAYSEILLRRTDILADLDALSSSYTETHPKILDLKAELAALDKETQRIFAVKPADAGKLTLALGKLMVRKAALEADLDRLTRSYSKDHPDVKRAQHRVDIFETSIFEILK